MELRNLSARLITINTEDGTEYQVLPGENPNTFVPDEVAKEGTLSGDFIKILIENGNLKVESDKESADDDVAKKSGKKTDKTEE